MAEVWYARCEDGAKGLVGEVACSLSPGCDVLFEETDNALRERLLATTPGRACAIVGPGTDEVDPVNLAAAIACDGHAREVTLVVGAASGSLRSRASRAGIARVLDVVQARGVARRQGFEGEDGAGPLDMPVFGDAIAPAQEAASPRHLGAGAAASKAGWRTVERREGAAPVIVLASGRGGCGKSAIAATMACKAASWGMRVGLVDLDLGNGCLNGYFGTEPSDLGALEGAASPTESDYADVGKEVAEGVTLWGPCLRPEMAETVSPYVGDLLATAANGCDLVVVDTSTTWTDAVAEAVQSCDRLLLVGDERAGAVAAMTRVAALAVRLGVARTRIARVTNRRDPREREEPFLFRADVGLETARAFSVLEGTDEVAECLSAGQVAQLAQEQGEFASSVASLLAKVLEELGSLPDSPQARAARDMQVGRRQRGLFGRMREAG